MPIKVIGEDASAILHATCRNCAAVLEYTPSDARYVKVNIDYLGDGDMVNAITCPKCNAVLQVKS